MLVVPAILLFASLLQRIHTMHPRPWFWMPPYGHVVDEFDAKIPHEKLRFTPIDFEWQWSRCELLRLQMQYSYDKDWWGPTGGKLTLPSARVVIRGEGDCFFRCISVLVTGTDEYHPAIRTAIVNYEKMFMTDLADERHINRVTQLGEGASKVEFIAASRLLETPIFMFDANWNRGRWSQFYTAHLDPLKWDDSVRCIYLKDEWGTHVEVVRSVYFEQAD